MTDTSIERILLSFENEQDVGTSLSSKEFGVMIRNSLTPFLETEESLRSTYIPFNQYSTVVQPVECRKAVGSLERLNTQIQAFYELLIETVQLPFVFASISYKLLFIVQLLEEQANRLIPLIEGYRAICMSSSQRAIRHRQYICDSFEKLLQQLAEITLQAEFLESEARFLERKFLNLKRKN
jgi:hypothetical protein